MSQINLLNVRSSHPLIRWINRYGNGLSFLLPALVLFALFSWYPIIKGFLVSFQSFHPVKPPHWVGLANFRRLLTDPLFYKAWGNVFYFMFLSFIIGYPVPIIMALAVNEMRHWRGFFRLIFYLPSIFPTVVVALMWKWFYDPSPAGLMNTLLRGLGLSNLGWLNDPNWAMPCLVLMGTWQNAGGTMLIYIAALQGVPEELYEAAEIDGASLIQRLFYITIPQIRTVMIVIFILQFLGTCQVFAEPFVMTKGGPNNATLTVLLLIYRYAFNYIDLGLAAALGVILFFVLLITTAVYLKVSHRLEEI